MDHYNGNRHNDSNNSRNPCNIKCGDYSLD
jgi:hypothetical protein